MLILAFWGTNFFPRFSSLFAYVTLLHMIWYTYLKMTSNVLAAAILQGKVLVFFIRSNNNGMNLVWIVSGLMQLARHENFSKQSAWSLQFRVVATVASQCNNAAERSALNWPPCPNFRTPYLARASITWTILVIMASKTSTLSSEIN